jgi:hypothetical protein
MAYLGKIGVPLNRTKIKHNSDEIDNEKLINLTMQLEFLIFRADSKMNDEDIISAVIKKRKTITKVINKTLSEGKNSNIYNEVYKNVNGVLNDEDIFNHIKSVEKE